MQRIRVLEIVGNAEGGGTKCVSRIVQHLDPDRFDFLVISPDSPWLAEVCAEYHARYLALPIFSSRLNPTTYRDLARAHRGSPRRGQRPRDTCGLVCAAHWIVETKGAETVEVAHKDRAARLWCENASMLTDTIWEYIKVRQTEFYELQPAAFSDITLMR